MGLARVLNDGAPWPTVVHSIFANEADSDPHSHRSTTSICMTPDFSL
jgi:hypothetical protein